ncbi:hypothetical protein [Brevundimonas sp.]|uniref:hypothetical protein n=1 Tax=Brevundimonas sp. TaxID=1871086 RepID=UPI002EDB7F4B
MAFAGLAGAAVLLAACAVTEPWPADRAWIDSGCEAAGWCGARGRLAVADGVGLLTLDDGRCLPIVLPPRIVAERARWDGRRVAVRGHAVDRTADGGARAGQLCPSSPLVMEARRFSLKADR